MYRAEEAKVRFIVKRNQQKQAQMEAQEQAGRLRSKNEERLGHISKNLENVAGTAMAGSGGQNVKTIVVPTRDDGTVWVPPSTIGIDETNDELGTRECDPTISFGGVSLIHNHECPMHELVYQ